MGAVDGHRRASVLDGRVLGRLDVDAEDEFGEVAERWPTGFGELLERRVEGRVARRTFRVR